MQAGQITLSLFHKPRKMSPWPRALCPFLTSESQPLGGSRFGHYSEDQSFGGSLGSSLTRVPEQETEPRHIGPSQQPIHSQSLSTGKGSFCVIPYNTAHWASIMKLFYMQSTPFTQWGPIVLTTNLQGIDNYLSIYPSIHLSFLSSAQQPSNDTRVAMSTPDPRSCFLNVVSYKTKPGLPGGTDDSSTSSTLTGKV